MQEQLFLDQNPWKQNKALDFLEQTIKRSFGQEIIKYLDKREIPILIGARQTGKSTLLYQIIEHLLTKRKINPQNIFYFSLDDLDLRKEIQENPKAILQYIEKWLGQNISDYSQLIYLFIDEAQKVPVLFDILKIIFDTYQNKIKIILSGSSSLELKKITTESLAGRIVYFQSYGFTLREALELKNKEKIKTKKISDLLMSNCLDVSVLKKQQAVLLPLKPRIEKLIQEIIVWGALPPVVKQEEPSEKLRFIQNYKTTYVEKDIAFLKEVGNSFDYLRLLEALACQAGQLLNISNLHQKLGLSINTVKKYLQVLKSTNILDLMPVYSQSAKVRLIKAPKILVFDNFLMTLSDQISEYEDLIKRNFLGRYLENFLIQEIKKDLVNLPEQVKYYFWRTSSGAEVDFVLQFKNQLIPFEIKTSQHLELKNLTGLKAFLKNHPEVEQSIVLYNGELKQEKNIIFIPIWLMV